jgi:tetratricopeptide (TPR) repeat protein
LDPKYIAAYINIGYALSCLKRYEEAIESYNKTLALGNTFIEAYINKGNALSSLNYNKAIELNKDYLAAYINKAYALEQHMKHIDKAIVCYDLSSLLTGL